MFTSINFKTMNKEFLTGNVTENSLIEAISLTFEELIKKYTSFQATKTDLKSMHWDGQDESHIYAIKFYWLYPNGDPQVLADELSNQIAHQSGQLFHELNEWAQRFAYHNNWNQV